MARGVQSFLGMQALSQAAVGMTTTTPLGLTASGAGVTSSRSLDVPMTASAGEKAMLATPQAITQSLVALRYSTATEISTFTLNSAPSGGYTMLSVDRPTILWPTTSTVVTTGLTGAVLSAGGTNYTVGDLLFNASGTPATGFAAVLQVTTVAAGVATAIAIVSGGNYTATSGASSLTSVCATTNSAASGLLFTASYGTYSQTYQSSGRVVSFAPERVPISPDLTMRSRGNGIVYLPNPGKYWLKHLLDGSETVSTNFVCIDATDGAIPTRYLSESGCHRVRTNKTVAVTSRTAMTTLLTPNRNRTGLIISTASGVANSPNASRCRLSFSPDPATTTTAQIVDGYGYEIGSSPNTTFSTFGEATWKGNVSACVSSSAATAVVPCVVNVLEWE